MSAPGAKRPDAALAPHPRIHHVYRYSRQALYSPCCQHSPAAPRPPCCKPCGHPDACVHPVASTAPRRLDHLFGGEVVLQIQNVARCDDGHGGDLEDAAPVGGWVGVWVASQTLGAHVDTDIWIESKGSTRHAGVGRVVRMPDSAMPHEHLRA